MSGGSGLLLLEPEVFLWSFWLVRILFVISFGWLFDRVIKSHLSFMSWISWHTWVIFEVSIRIRDMIHERRKEYRLSYTIVKVEQGTKEWCHRPLEPCNWSRTILWEDGATVGTNPRGSWSSDGVTDRTKEKWNKGGLEVAWNKELTWGSGLEADLYGTRPEGDITKVAQIGNHVGIGNLLGVDWER